MAVPARRAPLTCPRCSGETLSPAMTAQGVEIDSCPSCGGIWLDRGEIFHFARDRRALARTLEQLLPIARPGPLKSPKTGSPMNRFTLGRVELDACPDTEGIWLDKGELERIGEAPGGLRMSPAARPAAQRPAGPSSPQRLEALAAAAPALPNLSLRAVTMLVVMYGLLGALLVAAVELQLVPLDFAVVIAVAFALFQFLVGPWMMDLSLSWFYRLRWVVPEELPSHLRGAVQRITDRAGIPFPRFGIIADGAPNAFTYGHTPRNARVVLTEGMFELLEPDELEAVVAHELGHAVHWDMLLMTAASLVPLIAYYVYKTLTKIKVRGRDKSAGARMLIALGAYLVYIVTQYLVLWLSRTREYAADRYAGTVTGNPNALGRALVKIGYGLAGKDAKAEGATEDGSRRKAGLDALGALGIFDPRAARAMAIASGGATGLEAENLKGAMRWDLWNPWAAWYEVHSTHPLIAKRLDQLGRQAAGMGQEPLVVMDEEQPESYWDEFLVDVTISYLPFVLGGAVLALDVASSVKTGSELQPGVAVLALGAGMLLRTMFSYGSGPYPRMNVAGLLRQVKVSAVRGVPCTITATVIGRGVPGLIWSEDFVVRDESGLLFLDYRQPFGFLEFLFGLLRRGGLDRQKVTVTGWYRRAPVPFLEIKTLVADGGVVRRCYTYHAKIVVSLLVAAAGAWLLLAP